MQTATNTPATSSLPAIQQFAITFGTGDHVISSAGQSAVSIIAVGAPGAGAAYGQAAAAQLRAAVGRAASELTRTLPDELN